MNFITNHSLIARYVKPESFSFLRFNKKNYTKLKFCFQGKLTMTVLDCYN